MSAFRFTKLRVYDDAKVLHRDIVRLTSKFSGAYAYLIDQSKRCALSIVLNIAEGSGKDSDRDFNRYTQNALGSINELAACVDVMLDLGIIEAVRANDLLRRAELLKEKLGALSKALKG